ncbi:hypothetical protein EFQ99_31460 [Rhizobium vallis]|uniref:Core-binding (CB) domain-containing protein n=1 Tax=Rhizobium vallis TaxID=634290 RepID=A0A3S0QL06_9HYPH|nr:hypothetical protein [Rhizobium vallis]RUM19288.1 hypothetical protein EFQ99_31460 [Rhizobium vallis]
MANIRINRDGVIYKESQTFDRKAAANGWIIKREDELNQPGAIERLSKPQATLADAIDKYIETSLKAIGRTKAQVLAKIKDFPIAGKLCEKITSQDIVGLAEEFSEGRKPQTVGNYLFHLSAVFAIAKPAWG